jgi:hypothetical protein
MLANSSPNIRVVLVCNEEPVGLPVDSRLIVRMIDTVKPTNHSEMMTDKFIKYKTALTIAREFAPTWLMRADADDLVSCKLVDFIESKKSGRYEFWYSEYGWLYQMGSRFVIKQKDFHLHCGTSHVSFVARDELPESMEAFNDFYLLKESHSAIVRSRRAAGAPSHPIPFPTTVYTLNSGENASGNWSWWSHHSKRAKLKHLLNIRPITPRLREEFGL